jgi:hypothetical protein
MKKHVAFLIGIVTLIAVLHPSVPSQPPVFAQGQGNQRGAQGAQTDEQFRTLVENLEQQLQQAERAQHYPGSDVTCSRNSDNQRTWLTSEDALVAPFLCSVLYIPIERRRPGVLRPLANRCL